MVDKNSASVSSHQALEQAIYNRSIDDLYRRLVQSGIKDLKIQDTWQEKLSVIYFIHELRNSEFVLSLMSAERKGSIYVF